MNDLLQSLYPWAWWIIAGLLLIGELLMPGVFLMWLAAAAALTGVVDLLFGLSWQIETAIFAVLSFLLVLASRKWMPAARGDTTDEPHLNQRHVAYVGRVYVLDSGIQNGKGKLRIEDVTWDIEGPDMVKGARVRVKATNGMRLVVESA